MLYHRTMDQYRKYYSILPPVVMVVLLVPRYARKEGSTLQSKEQYGDRVVAVNDKDVSY